MSTRLLKPATVILSKGDLGKKTEVITVDPPSANSSTEAASMKSLKSILAFAESLGAYCLPANPFAKSTLPDDDLSMKNLLSDAS